MHHVSNLLSLRADRFRRLTLLVNLVCTALAIAIVLGVATALVPGDNDLEFYRGAAQSLQRFSDPYAVANGYAYPPLLAILLTPLAQIDPPLAQRIWFAINVAALIALIGLCYLLSATNRLWRFWGVIALATAAAPCTTVALGLGQLGLMIAACLLAAQVLAGRWPGIAGGVLALASLVKLYPALFGLYYLLRRRAVAGWAILAGVTLVGATLMRYGTLPYRVYLSRIFLREPLNATVQFNISITGFWSRLFSNGPFSTPIVAMPLVVSLLIAASALLVVGICLWLTWPASQRAATSDTAQAEFSLWVCAMLLLSPMNGYYNLTILLLPFLTIMQQLDRTPSRQMRNWLFVATLLLWAHPTWTYSVGWLYTFTHNRWGLLLLAPSFYGLCIYFVLLVIQLRRARV